MKKILLILAALALVLALAGCQQTPTPAPSYAGTWALQGNENYRLKLYEDGKIDNFYNYDIPKASGTFTVTGENFAATLTVVADGKVVTYTGTITPTVLTFVDSSDNAELTYNKVQ